MLTVLLDNTLFSTDCPDGSSESVRLLNAYLIDRLTAFVRALPTDSSALDPGVIENFFAEYYSLTKNTNAFLLNNTALPCNQLYFSLAQQLKPYTSKNSAYQLLVPTLRSHQEETLSESYDQFPPKMMVLSGDGSFLIPLHIPFYTAADHLTATMLVWPSHADTSIPLSRNEKDRVISRNPLTQQLGEDLLALLRTFEANSLHRHAVEFVTGAEKGAAHVAGRNGLYASSDILKDPADLKAHKAVNGDSGVNLASSDVFSAFRTFQEALKSLNFCPNDVKKLLLTKAKPEDSVFFAERLYRLVGGAAFVKFCAQCLPTDLAMEVGEKVFENTASGSIVFGQIAHLVLKTEHFDTAEKKQLEKKLQALANHYEDKTPDRITDCRTKLAEHAAINCADGTTGDIRKILVSSETDWCKSALPNSPHNSSKADTTNQRQQFKQRVEACFHFNTDENLDTSEFSEVTLMPDSGDAKLHSNLLQFPDFLEKALTTNPHDENHAHLFLAAISNVDITQVNGINERELFEFVSRQKSRVLSNPTLRGNLLLLFLNHVSNINDLEEFFKLLYPKDNPDSALIHNSEFRAFNLTKNLTGCFHLKDENFQLNVAPIAMLNEDSWFYELCNHMNEHRAFITYACSAIRGPLNHRFIYRKSLSSLRAILDFNFSTLRINQTIWATKSEIVNKNKQAVKRLYAKKLLETLNNTDDIEERQALLAQVNDVFHEYSTRLYKNSPFQYYQLVIGKKIDAWLYPIHTQLKKLKALEKVCFDFELLKGEEDLKSIALNSILSLGLIAFMSYTNIIGLHMTTGAQSAGPLDPFRTHVPTVVLSVFSKTSQNIINGVTTYLPSSIGTPLIAVIFPLLNHLRYSWANSPARQNMFRGLAISFILLSSTVVAILCNQNPSFTINTHLIDPHSTCILAPLPLDISFPVAGMLFGAKMIPALFPIASLGVLFNQIRHWQRTLLIGAMLYSFFHVFKYSFLKSYAAESALMNPGGDLLYCGGQKMPAAHGNYLDNYAGSLYSIAWNFLLIPATLFLSQKIGAPPSSSQTERYDSNYTAQPYSIFENNFTRKSITRWLGWTLFVGSSLFLFYVVGAFIFSTAGKNAAIFDDLTNLCKGSFRNCNDNQFTLPTTSLSATGAIILLAILPTNKSVVRLFLNTLIPIVATVPAAGSYLKGAGAAFFPRTKRHGEEGTALLSPCTSPHQAA